VGLPAGYSPPRMTRWAFALSLLALSGCAAPSTLGVGLLAPGPAALPPPAPLAAPAPVDASTPPAAVAPALGAGLADAATPTAGSADELAALDDDEEDQATTTAPPHLPSQPAGPPLTDAEVDHRFHHDLASLGPASVGPASAGALVNGVQMPKGEHWQLLDAGHAWGTQETVDALVRSIERVNERFPGAPPLAIGHLSAKNGGHLNPHRSHQSGRDADVGYYYKSGTRPFVHATEDNLDLPRTWTLLKTALQESTIDMIFIDRLVQRAIADYAVRSGEDVAFVDRVFQIRGKNAAAPIRHIHGHDNHIHFRWHNPIAEEMGRRVARFVVIPRAPVARAAVAANQPETTGYAQIRAHSGDTLVILARRYGTTVEEIQRANGLGGNAIRAGIVYRIPQKAVAKAPAKPPQKPARQPQRVAQRHAAKPGLHTPARAAGAKSGAAAPSQ
jgi:murein endopeptidase